MFIKIGSEFFRPDAIISICGDEGDNGVFFRTVDGNSYYADGFKTREELRQFIEKELS